MSDYTSTTIDGVQIHMDTDSDGCMNLWTDGYFVSNGQHLETFKRIVVALRGLQSDDERELDCLLGSRHRHR